MMMSVPNWQDLFWTSGGTSFLFIGGYDQLVQIFYKIIGENISKAFKMSIAIDSVIPLLKIFFEEIISTWSKTRSL